MATRIQLRNDTAANWTSNDPVLAVGEVGVETDTDKFKFGDGVTVWTSLPYAAAGTGNVDTSGTPAANDFARFTDANTIEGRSPAEVRADLDLEVGVDLATAAQGALADTATQPGDLGTLAAQNDIAVPGDITATGTPLATTYLDGTGAWSVPAGAGGSTEVGVYLLEDFAGADDDAKLAAAIAQVQSDTFKRPIALWEDRVYTFTDPVDLFNGFGLIGPPRHGGQVTTTARTAHEVKINIGAKMPFLRVPASGDIYNVHVSNLSFEAVGTQEVLLGYDPAGAAAGNLWTSVFHNLSTSLFYGTIGTYEDRLLCTGSWFTGFWNINNGRHVAIHLAGSDCTLFPEGCFLDSPDEPLYGDLVPYHMWLDYLEKSNIGPMFITCEKNPQGIRISGSASQGALVFNGGIRVEGRNAGLSSLGSVVHMDGGKAVFFGAWLCYGGSNFATANALTGRSGDAGIVTVSGGAEANFINCFYARAGTDGVADTVPWIYATGAGTKIRVTDAMVLEDGGTFATTGKAHVRCVSSATFEYHDQSITDVDAAYKIPGYGNVNHGATAGTARPTTHEHYIWTGTVEPTNKTGQDIAIVEA